MIILLLTGETDALPNLNQNDKSDDYIFDETTPDVNINIVAAEGFNMYCGWLGKGPKRL